MPASLSLLFAGTPAFSVPALQALLRSPHRVLAVYTQPDRPAGRGRQLTMSPVKECALEHELPLRQPATFRDPQAVEELRSWSADLMIVVAYGLILPQSVLDAPRLGCVNIHGSLLPRWRGAAPIQRAILAGDELTGVTIMQMDAGLDTGPMLLERTTPIGPRDTTATLHDRLATLGAEALLAALDDIAAGNARPRPQPSEGVEYAAKIQKSEALIVWAQPARDIDRRIRAFNPWPIAETRWQGQQLRVWEAQPLSLEASAAPGTVVDCSDEGVDVATGAGVLRVTRLQLPGRKALSAAEFVRAHRLEHAVLGS